MQRVIGGKRYDSDKAVLLASDRYWNGHSLEQDGRNSYLYRISKDLLAILASGGARDIEVHAYFVVYTTMWQGEWDYLEPVSLERAREFYEGALTQHAVEYEVAFPSVEVEDA